MQGALVRSLVVEQISRATWCSQDKKRPNSQGMGYLSQEWMWNAHYSFPRDFPRREIRRMEMCDVYPVEYYSVAKKGWSADMWDHVDKPWNMLTERSQAQNDTYCTIPFI